MNTTLLPFLKGCIFYLPFFWSGKLIGDQIMKMVAIEDFSMLHEKVKLSLGSVLSAVFAIILLYVFSYVLIYKLSRSSSEGVRKYRRKKQFYKWHKSNTSGSEVKTPKLWITLLFLLFSSVISGVLICFYLPLAQWLYSLSLDKLSEYGLNLKELPMPVNIVVALCSLIFAMIIYALVISSKHGPIHMTYRIRGSLGGFKALFSLLWKKAKVNRFGINLQTEDLIGVSKQNRITELVTAKDYYNNFTKKYYLGHLEENEPHEVIPEISKEQVESIIDHLHTFAEKGEKAIPLNRDNYLQIARQAHFYEMVTKGELKDLKIDQVEHVLRAMRQKNSFNKEDSAMLAEYVNSTKVFDIGGMFNELIFQDQNDSFIPFVRLRENPLQTRYVSVQEYGKQAIEEGKILIVTSFTAFDSSNEDDNEEQSEDTEAFGSERNTIRENHKPLNRILFDGFGASYSFIHKDSRYVYDEWWTGSFKPLMRLIPGLHKETSLRRIGYIREIGGKVVAKISDVHAPLKLFGTYNRDIDIYCSKLASDNNFGARLCLFSQFLTHQVTYRNNLSQQMMSLNPKYSAGDIDQSQH